MRDFLQEGSSLHVESIGTDRVAVRQRQPGAVSAGRTGHIVLRVPPGFCSLDITSGGTQEATMTIPLIQQSLLACSDVCVVGYT